MREILFPIATLILGYVGSLLTEAWRERRVREREREARRAERQHEVDRRRIEFQRTTLMDLQVAAQRVGRVAGAIKSQDATMYHRARAAGSPITYGTQQLTDGWGGERGLDPLTDFARLTTRLEDAETRALADRFRDRVSAVMTARAPVDAEDAMSLALTVFTELQERLGSLLRTDYGVTV